MLNAQERRKYDSLFSALWKIDLRTVILPSERHAASIKDVYPGGVLRVGGEYFVVTSMATLTETNEKFTKPKDYVVTELVLYSLKTGEVRYIEWEEDDVVKISFTERKLGKAELGSSLRYDDGEVVDLDDIDEIVEKEWDLVFNGQNYSYDDDYPAKYESSTGKSFFAYIYEFGDEHVGWLTVEAWSSTGKEDDTWEYEVYLSRTIDEASVEIVSTGSL